MFLEAYQERCKHLTLSSFFLLLEKRPVLLLYWFAAQQQTSTLTRQNVLVFT